MTEQLSKNDLLGRLISAILLSLIVTGLLYGSMFTFFYFTADKVECGSIGPIPYCSGVYKDVQVNKSVEIQRNISDFRSTVCYRNGERINCSESFIITNQRYYEEIVE